MSCLLRWFFLESPEGDRSNKEIDTASPDNKLTSGSSHVKHTDGERLDLNPPPPPPRPHNPAPITTRTTSAKNVTAINSPCGKATRQLDMRIFRITTAFWILFEHNLAHIMSQQKRYIDSMLFQCWTSVADGGPTLKRHWVNISCLLGCRVHLLPTLKCFVASLNSPICGRSQSHGGWRIDQCL